MHGAGLVNGVFADEKVIVVELKTVYGFHTDLFARVADSRVGTFVHIDVRNYSAPNRDHTADLPLAVRVLEGISKAIAHQEKGNHGGIYRISEVHEDYIIGPSSTKGDLGHILGPYVKNITQTCYSSLPYAIYRKLILGSDDSLQYCTECDGSNHSF